MPPFRRSFSLSHRVWSASVGKLASCRIDCGRLCTFSPDLVDLCSVQAIRFLEGCDTGHHWCISHISHRKEEGFS